MPDILMCHQAPVPSDFDAKVPANCITQAGQSAAAATCAACQSVMQAGVSASAGAAGWS
jgi:hypothetical protein